MNGNWYPWSEQVNGNLPGEYVQAWRKVHDIFEEEGARNVTWVWCVNKDYSGATDVGSLYPGDAYVDWLSLDAYNRGTEGGGSGSQFGGASWETFGGMVKPTYDKLLATSSGKPVMLAEFGSAEQGGSKASWFGDALRYALKEKFPRIKAAVYFNVSKGYDNRIDSSASSLAAFRDGIQLSYYATNAYGASTMAPIPPLLSDQATLDTMGPFVNIVSPTKGSVGVNSTVHIQIDSTDRSGTQSVEVYVNGVLLCTERERPYECYWKVPAGTQAYTLTAKAFDKVGNVATSSVFVNVP
jgi:hypothetical protein